MIKIMRKAIPITLLFSLVSAYSNMEIKFDLDLIYELSSTPGPNDKHPFPPPYYVVFKKGPKEVAYLSSKHSSDPNSKTHQIIDQLFKNFNPESVIVEFPTHDPKTVEKILSRCDPLKKCVEGIYAYKKAINSKIDKVGGEPTDIEVINSSIKSGLNRQEIVFFYVYRGVASWRQGDPDRSYTPPNPSMEIKKYINSAKKRLKQEDLEFDYSDFLSLYERKMGKKFNYKNTRYSDIAPYRGGHYIQQLSLIIDKTREENILRVLENKINRFNKVLIVYGSGHYLKHRPVLKEAFKNHTIFISREQNDDNKKNKK